MADTELEYTGGFVDKRRVQGQATTNLSTNATYQSISSLRTRLTTIDSTYFSTVRLNGMTKNDMIYAIRLADDAAGV
jgi:hypothetical protein